MNIAGITYFSVVAETASVRKAAEWMQLSPPALSRAIKQLEEELGVVPYLVSGKNDCTLFLTASKADGREGRPFCARTTDGGRPDGSILLCGSAPGNPPAMALRLIRHTLASGDKPPTDQ